MFQHAERGLTAGNVLTGKYRHILSPSAVPASPGRGSSNVSMSDVFSAGESDEVQSFSVVNYNQSDDTLFDVADLPLLKDLFGDNPQRWRAFAALSVSDSLSEQELWADIFLNGGETVNEIIDRAIAWRLFMKDYDPSRFGELDTNEQYELSVRIVAGWRKF